MTQITLTTEQLNELRDLVTHDEAGQHFTEWSRHYESLEDAGLIEIYRPVHEQTGIMYSQEYWSVEHTEEGLDLVQRHFSE